MTVAYGLSNQCAGALNIPCRRETARIDTGGVRPLQPEFIASSL